ncbi:hypothetical protein Hanom_Chr01g00031691 [Helianthus anomalus]
MFTFPWLVEMKGCQNTNKARHETTAETLPYTENYKQYTNRKTLLRFLNTGFDYIN